MNKVDAFELIFATTRSYVVSPQIIDIVYDGSYTTEDKFYEVYLLLRKNGMTNIDNVVALTNQYLDLPDYVAEEPDDPEEPETPPVDGM